MKLSLRWLSVPILLASATAAAELPDQTLIPPPAKVVDSVRSHTLYMDGLKRFQLDTVRDYEAARLLFADALVQDPGNARAVAMHLAAGIHERPELAKNAEYVKWYQDTLTGLTAAGPRNGPRAIEAVEADLELALAIGKPEQGEKTILAYAKTTAISPASTPELYYLMARIFLAEGKLADAAKFSGQIPEGSTFPALLYLRGQIAEKEGNRDKAFQAYSHVLRVNPAHSAASARLKALQK